MLAFEQRFGRKPTQLSQDKAEARLAITGDPVALRFKPVFKALLHATEDEDCDDFTYTVDDVLRYAKALTIVVPSPWENKGSYAFTHTPDRVLLQQRQAGLTIHQDFQILLQVCTIPKQHCASHELDSLSIDNLASDWAALRAEPDVRKMLEEEFGTTLKGWLIPWHLMQAQSDREDQLVGLHHPNFRSRVLCWMLKWRAYFQPRLVHTNMWSNDDDLAPTLGNDFRISPFVPSPYTPEQQEVLKAINKLNEIYAEQVDTTNAASRSRRLSVAKEAFRRSLAQLMQLPHFSFDYNQAQVDWPVTESPIQWRYLFRPYSGIIDPDKYLGVVHRNIKKFNHD